MSVLACCGQFAQHIFIEVSLHIQVCNVMLIQILQAGNDFLEHLGCGNQEHGVAHIPGERCVGPGSFFWFIRDFDQFSLRCKIWKASIFHVFDCWKDPLRHDRVNLPGIVIFELTPAHGLPGRGLWENFIHFFIGHILEGFRFQLLLVQGPDKHQICELLNHRQGVGNSTGPNVCPDFVDLVFNHACDHRRPPILASPPRSLSRQPSYIPNCTILPVKNQRLM